MSLKCGIVGLPNVGKSTLYNALVSGHVDASNYPFCTIEPNVGIISIPDPRLPKIAQIIGSAKHTPATTKIVDIAGLVKGASLGEGLGNQFLSHIREVDAIIHIVRCFIDDDIVHVDGSVDPQRDIDVINTELLLADLQTIEKKLEKDKKAARVGEKKAKKNLPLLERLQAHIDKGNPARTFSTESNEDQNQLLDLLLLTQKPMLYVANSNGSAEETKAVNAIAEKTKKDEARHLILDCKLEAEIASFPEEEREEYLAELGLKESGLNRLIHSTFDLLGLITFYSANSNEVRSWTLKCGTKAPQAAGIIHSDFEKGFIKAECYKVDDLFRLGSEQKIREAGLCHIEGKNYVVEKDDVLLFRFNL